MSSDTALYKPQDPSVINELVATLNDADRKKPKDVGFSCRKSTFKIDGTTHSVDSWKFPEQDFKKHCLPTFARGLFTWRDPVSGNYRIAVRGYDKFFNIDEINRTSWDWIEKNTKAPYELTMKENGCIIFISGLPDGTLMVCSKHSIGARVDAHSHAVVGETWVDKQLAQIGRTRMDLALTLYNANATAVAELCDDSFEEHILAYEGDKAGLYLHGINLNLKDFATYPSAEVRKFADEWAFRKIDYLVKDNVADLRKFLEEAAETGSWDERDVEGFVIRCKARNGPDDPEWHDWFFKYKFEEPYLMYRQWRECTKAMIAGRQPRYKKHQGVTKEYLRFATGYFTQHKGSSEQYNHNHGIIRVRDAFLASRGLRGSDIVKQSEQDDLNDEVKKLVLVPVATIGCGKTTVAHALAKLFGWVHKQNDDITVKKNKGQAFATACAMALVDTDAVIADKNNHQKRERKQLFQDLGNSVPLARFVALHYVHYDGIDDNALQNRIRTATRNRVFTRGDNHQTIQAATMGRARIQGIMEGFMGRFEPVDVETEPDCDFDMVIDLDPTKDSRENLEIIVNKLHDAYPTVVPRVPSSEELDDAIKAAFEEYKPSIKHTIAARGGPKGANQKHPAEKKVDVEYFSISLPTKSVLDAIGNSLSQASEEKRAFFEQLEKDGRVQNSLHVTLIHQASSKAHPVLWQKYLKLREENTGAGPLGRTAVILESLVWDGRVMTIASKIPSEDWPCSNEIPHVTIGTASPDIKPKEANDMLVKKWKAGAETEQVDLGDVEVYGDFEAVLRGGR